MRNVTNFLKFLVLLVIRSCRSGRLEALLLDELYGSVIENRPVEGTAVSGKEPTDANAPGVTGTCSSFYAQCSA